MERLRANASNALAMDHTVLPANGCFHVLIVDVDS